MMKNVGHAPHDEENVDIVAIDTTRQETLAILAQMHDLSGLDGIFGC